MQPAIGLITLDGSKWGPSQNLPALYASLSCLGNIAPQIMDIITPAFFAFMDKKIALPDEFYSSLVVAANAFQFIAPDPCRRIIKEAAMEQYSVRIQQSCLD